MEVDKIGVHKTHCCLIHGCKYGDEDCPVVTKQVEQQYPCEDCDSVKNQIKRYINFIDHNLELGYITEDMSITQFKEIFLKSIIDDYLSMLDSINI